MCTRDYSGYEIVLSGFFGSVGVWPHHQVTPAMRRKTVDVMDALPRNPTGKILKKDLRKPYWEGRDRQTV